MKQDNRNPLSVRAGIWAIFLAIILFLVNSRINSSNLNLLSGVLFIGGIILVTYGLTKIDIPEDKGYQKYVRLSNKILLTFVCIFLIVCLIGAVLQFPAYILIILFVLGIIFGVFYVINEWIFYIKTYKYAKKINSKLNSKQKRNQLIFLIIIIVLGLGLWYLINYIILK